LRVLTTALSFEAPSYGTPTNIRTNLIPPIELTFLGYVFAGDSMGVPSFKFPWWAVQ